MLQRAVAQILERGDRSSSPAGSLQSLTGQPATSAVLGTEPAMSARRGLGACVRVHNQPVGSELAFPVLWYQHHLRVDITFSKPSALSGDGSASDAARYLVLPGRDTYGSVCATN